MKSAFQEFNRINGHIEHSYHEAAVKMGLSDSELWILYTLLTNESQMLQSELISLTGISKTTINSALKKMERENLLKLIPGNRRNTCVCLTPQGNQLAEETVSRLVILENQIYESWSEEEQALLIKLNKDYADRLAELVKTL